MLALSSSQLTIGHRLVSFQTAIRSFEPFQMARFAATVFKGGQS
jgi:hypothetical protein